MPNLTQLITRQSGLLAWYPLDNDGGDPSTLSDESGNNRDLVADPELPDTRGAWTANQLNGRPAVVHNNETIPFGWTGALSVSDIFIVGKVDDVTDFDGTFRGLASGIDDTNSPILVGVGGTTRWLSIAEGSPAMGYLLDDVLQADGSRQAPFTAFHRMRMSVSGGPLLLDGIQFGRDREHTDRLIKAKWADAMFWNPQRTTDEAKAIALYHDLKFDLWRTNGTTLYFPTPGMTGIRYRRFHTLPKKWEDTVLSHEYEDGGRSFNEITDTAVQEWDVEFDCVDSTHALAKSQYEIFDEFWNAVRTSRAFSFTDKYGTTHTNVRIKEYSRSHSAHKSWQNVVAFRLCKYP